MDYGAPSLLGQPLAVGGRHAHLDPPPIIPVSFAAAAGTDLERRSGAAAFLNLGM